MQQGLLRWAVCLSLLCPGPLRAQHLEAVWADAAASFDGLRASGLVVAGDGSVVRAQAFTSDAAEVIKKLDESVKKQASASTPPQDPPASDPPAPNLTGPIFKTQDVWGPGGVPTSGDKKPTGIGPISWKRDPGYLKGLLGGLMGLLLAPLALALEIVQAVIMTPVRMVRGMINGDWTAILEPVRTVKNLVQDTLMTAFGMLNHLTAPVWNAFRPDQTTDFVYANNRLIFRGGPIAALVSDSGRWSAFAPSWHTVFDTSGIGGRSYEHEFVHNRQWQQSFLWEKIGEDYRGYKGWKDSDAHDYLNW